MMRRVRCVDNIHHIECTEAGRREVTGVGCENGQARTCGNCASWGDAGAQMGRCHRYDAFRGAGYKPVTNCCWRKKTK